MSDNESLTEKTGDDVPHANSAIKVEYLEIPEHHPNVHKVADAAFGEGSCFESFEAFERNLHIFEALEGEQFVEKEYTLLAEGNELLKYKEIVYGCTYGEALKAQRAHWTRSQKALMKCPANIQIKADRDRKYLVIVCLQMNHNHETSKASTSGDIPVDARAKVLKPIIDELFGVTIDSTTDQKFCARLEAMRSVLQDFLLDSENQEEPVVDLDIENLSIQFEKQNSLTESNDIGTIVPLKVIADADGSLNSDINDNALIAMAEQVQTTALEVTDDTYDVDSAGLSIKASHYVKSKGKPNSIQTFYEQDDEFKIRDILSWLVDASIIEDIINRKYFIRHRDLDLDHLRDSLADEAVDINLLVPYVKTDVFTSLCKALAIKKKKDLFTCGTCDDRVVDDCVICDRCLLWYHFLCVDLKRAPRTKIWFCPKCKNVHPSNLKPS